MNDVCRHPALAVRAVLAALALVGAACASAPPPAPAAVAPALRPASPRAPVAPPLPDVTFRVGEPPRRALAVAVVVAPPAATAKALDGLARKLALPVPLGQELLGALTRGELAAGVRLTRAQLERLDGARPMTAAVLGLGIGVESGVCAAFAFKDAAGARRTLEELGRETSRHGGESTRHLPSGATIVAGVHGRTLFLSSGPRTIAVAGPLAEELQERPAASAVAVTVYPRAFLPLDAEALGNLLESRVTSALEQRPKPADGGGARPVDISPRFLGALARMAAVPMAESRAVTIAVDADERAGLAFNVVVEPQDGSSLARALARQSPYVFDPTLALSAGASEIAWGGFMDVDASFGELFSATGPKGRAARAATDALLARVRGGVSCSVDFTLPVRSRCAYALRPGSKGADVLRRYAAWVKANAAWANEAFGTRAPMPNMKTKGGALEIEQAVDTSSMAASASIVAAMMGGATQRSLAVVRGDALIVAQGVDPRAVLAAPAPPEAARPPGLAAALARTKGANLLVYIDFVNLIMRMLASADDPTVRQAGTMVRAVHGLDALQVPFVLSARSGGAGRYELALPVESLENVARVIGPYMGVMGGRR